MKNIDCKLCGAQAHIMMENYPGYQEPDTYAVYECYACDTQFVDPLEINQDVYDLIYGNIENVPGYNRYQEYAIQVREQTDPLSYLAESESMYWFIKDYLDKNSVCSKSNILEFGCGLGYLTFALRKAGFCAHGIDISHKAVEKAKSSYGEYYTCADIKDFAKEEKGSFDIILLTEVVEHLPDFLNILDCAKSLLSKNGVILLTTPNKSFYAPKSLWQTETPPIHLWWLSETSLRIVATKISMRAEIWDYSSKVLRYRRKSLRSYQKIRQPIFGKNGELLAKAKQSKKLSSPFKQFMKRAREMLTRSTPNKYPFRTKIVAAVLHKND